MTVLGVVGRHICLALIISNSFQALAGSKFYSPLKCNLPPCNHIDFPWKVLVFFRDKF